MTDSIDRRRFLKKVGVVGGASAMAPLGGLVESVTPAGQTPASSQEAPLPAYTFLTPPEAAFVEADGVLGSMAGARDDFRYSAAMRRSGIVWTLETIDAFVADPKRYMRGNRTCRMGASRTRGSERICWPI